MGGLLVYIIPPPLALIGRLCDPPSWNPLLPRCDCATLGWLVPRVLKGALVPVTVWMGWLTLCAGAGSSQTIFCILGLSEIREIKTHYYFSLVSFR